MDPTVVNERFKRKVLERGGESIQSLRRCFGIIDKDKSGMLDKEEFKRVLTLYKLDMNPKEFGALWEFYDRDESGTVSFDELITGLRNNLKGMRKDLVDAAFDKMDADGSGELTYEDLEDKYDVSRHPRVLNKEWTKEQALTDFLTRFEGEGGNKDGTVTREEWYDYFTGISGAIDEDEYFGVMMRNSWGVDYLPASFLKTFVKRLKIKAAQKAGNQENPKQTIKKTFAYFDTDRSKDVDQHEFNSAIDQLVTGYDEEEKRLLFKYFDTDSSGTISYDEFCNFVFNQPE